MSMTAITIRIWIPLPNCGILGLMFRPKKPSSHSITRTTMIVSNMRFLLLNVRMVFATIPSYSKGAIYVPDTTYKISLSYFSTCGSTIPPRSPQALPRMASEHIPRGVVPRPTYMRVTPTSRARVYRWRITRLQLHRRLADCPSARIKDQLYLLDLTYAVAFSSRA